jgi:2-dehydropantoate 2-reductase
MKFAILGAGALGGYYGARLVESGQEVHFLVRSDKKEIQEKGLAVQSINGDFTVHPAGVYDKAEDLPLCDVVCVALKSSQNHQLKEILKYCLKPNGIIVVWQNGIGLEEQLQAEFPEATVIGGLCFLCSNKVGPGQIHHIDSGRISLAQLTDSDDFEDYESLLNLQSIFKAAKIPTEIVADLALARWQKLVWNIPYNGLCTLLNADTTQIMNHSESAQLIWDLMKEVQSAAQSCGTHISDQFLEKMIENTLKMKAYRPSMMLDFLANRPLELDVIYASPIQMAAKNQCVLPKIQMLYQQLCFVVNAKNLG